MKKRNLLLLAGLLLASFAGGSAFGATNIISDTYGPNSSVGGFNLDQGINTGINPPTTRLTGTAAAGLRYAKTAGSGSRADTTFTITGSKFDVVRDAALTATVSLSSGGGAFDFSSALGTLAATPTNKASYDIAIKMKNRGGGAGTGRFSFAFGANAGNATAWDFGIQVYRAVATDAFATVGKRVSTTAAGVATALNSVITTTAAWNTELSFLIRVTDAGAESTTFNSRVEISLDGGDTWVYNSDTDGELPNKWRLTGAARYFIWDIANTSATYDDFSVTWNSGPALPEPGVVRTWNGHGTDDNWATAGNWDSGTAPGTGDMLIFSGAARQVNYNNIDSLLLPWITFNNGGFELTGNALKLSSGITNLAGSNAIALDTSWAMSGSKYWNVAGGSELVLRNPSLVDVTGDNFLGGGGTLRLDGPASALRVGPAGTVNPLLSILEGRFLIDGGTFWTRGGLRIGSLANATNLAEVIVTNNGTISMQLAASNIRLGDTASPKTRRLVMDNSTVALNTGVLTVPYAAGATCQVSQVAGTFSGGSIVFSDNGAGDGTYSVNNGGVVQAIQIRKDTPEGRAAFYFDNATLRTDPSANSNFLSGLDIAEIQSGGLTLDANYKSVAISSPLSGSGWLTKVGYEAVTLTGANTYAGNTDVQAGKLVLPTTQTNSALIQVADNSPNYAELGVLVTIPGSTLTAGTLNLGSGGGSTLSFDLVGLLNPTAPLMRVGSLSANGTVTLNIRGVSPLMTPGTIHLIKHTGGIGGGGSFVLGDAPGLNAQVVDNPGSLDLVISGVQGFLWTGATDSNWDTSTPNWFSHFNSQSAAYADGYMTEFRDGAASGNINVGLSPAAPALMVVSNTTLAYTFSYGSIQTPMLKKSGAGSLTRLDGADTFQSVEVNEGSFVVNRGTLTAPVLVKSGAGTLTRIDASSDALGELQLNEGSFVASSASDATFATKLTDTNSGLGTFVKQGAGTLTVATNSSTFDGAILIEEGVYKLGSAGALGSTNGSTTVRPGASLDLNNNAAQHERVIVSGAGVGGQGAIFSSAAAAAGQNLTEAEMVDHTTFGAATGGRMDIRARLETGPAPGLLGNGYNLTKVGGGQLIIACQRTLTNTPAPYWDLDLGNIVVNEGWLSFEESLSLGNGTGTLTVMPGATVSFRDLGLTNPVVRNITVTDANLDTAGASTATTNVFSGSIFLSGTVSMGASRCITIINGSLSGNASLNLYAAVNNSGRTILNGVNTYTGETTVTNGTLGGYGSIAGNLVMLGGTLSPGFGVGTFTVGGNATLAGTTAMELAPGQVPNCDRLNVAGTLTAAGALAVSLAPGAAAPQSGDSFQLFNKGVPGFASISLPTLGSGLGWATNSLATTGTLQVVSTVPPSIGTVSFTDGTFAFSGTGGTEGSSYYVVTSTNVAAPMANWTAVATNVFGPGGAFSFSTNILSSDPGAFFRVKIP